MSRAILLAATALLASCAMVPPLEEAATPPVVAVQNDPALASFFGEYDRQQLALSPMAKTYRAIVDEDYGRWDEFTDEAAQREETLLQQAATALRTRFDRARLSPADQLSYDLFVKMAERSAGAFQHRRNGYIFNQMFGAQSSFPAFMINIHRVSDLPTAEAYVARLEGLGRALDQSMAEAEARAAMGVMPPRWVYPHIISDARNVISGAPFDRGPDSALYEDLKKKLSATSLAAGDRQRLLDRGRLALQQQVKPAYERLIALMGRQQQVASAGDGVWRLPNGAEYYAERLRYNTTTDLSADEIHSLGLREVERIHGEMRRIMAQVGFAGTLQQFFQYVRTSDQFFHSSREAYLAEVQQVFDRVTPVLPRFFNRLPAAELDVRPVEAFRERTAGKAFYSRPAPDGSRPGIYYVNLYNLRDMSRTELEALAYHEGVPGHHLQLAIQTELGDVPPFRQFGGVTAYSEGWGLYSEELGKDMGFYTDPYSDFGRLGMELWRAARLVTDTGLHHKRWSREQAIRYLQEHTPNPEGDIRRAIERYAVMPGQANAYTIGKLKIMELRENARRRLGDRFDIRSFHDAVLLSGPVPLDILERNVEGWVQAELAR